MDGLLAGGRQLTPTAWSVVQHGLSELLISPADKRRAGIALNKSARSTLMRMLRLSRSPSIGNG